jgi:ATP:cob(I)alamin adenosyltransferase
VAIYTKTGDKGKTGTFSGKRISKSSELINAIGAIDELNSFLGTIGGLTEIQRNLFTINSILTGAKLELPKDATRKLEREIDKWEGSMPVLKNFIIYSGSKKATQIFFARSLTRRAERSLVNLKIKSQKLEIFAYINRLSDYLFMLARFTNFRSKISEKIWKA